MRDDLPGAVGGLAVHVREARAHDGGGVALAQGEIVDAVVDGDGRVGAQAGQDVGVLGADDAGGVLLRAGSGARGAGPGAGASAWSMGQGAVSIEHEQSLTPRIRRDGRTHLQEVLKVGDDLLPGVANLRGKQGDESMG